MFHITFLNSPGPPLSSTNKTDRHNITEILLKVALNTRQNQPNQNIPGEQIIEKSKLTRTKTTKYTSILLIIIKCCLPT